MTSTSPPSHKVGTTGHFRLISHSLSAFIAGSMKCQFRHSFRMPRPHWALTPRLVLAYDVSALNCLAMIVRFKQEAGDRTASLKKLRKISRQEPLHNQNAVQHISTQAAQIPGFVVKQSFHSIGYIPHRLQPRLVVLAKIVQNPSGSSTIGDAASSQFERSLRLPQGVAKPFSRCVPCPAATTLHVAVNRGGGGNLVQ